MIVLDEQLQGLGLEDTVARWYRGSVLVVKTLRPGTVIKDEAIPSLLRRLRTHLITRRVNLPRTSKYSHGAGHVCGTGARTLPTHNCASNAQGQS